jgi:hypothetical protein
VKNRDPIEAEAAMEDHLIYVHDYYWRVAG